MEPEQIRTKRLTLVPCTVEVGQAVMLDRPSAERMLGASLHPEWPGQDTRDFVPLYLHRLRNDPGLLGWGVWLVILEEGPRRTVIGDLGYKGPPGEDGSVDIGYGIAPSQRDKGYATEASRALIDWAFGHDAVKDVTGECLVENAASARVLRKSGLMRTGREGSLYKWRLHRTGWELRTRDPGTPGRTVRGIHYIEQGSGFPVVLVHGFGCSSVQWMYTVPALAAAGYRAIALDLPGFGESRAPEAPIRTSRYAFDLIRFLDDLKLPQAALIGNSMGGFVSWYAAAQAPDRVAALVLADPAGAPPPENAVTGHRLMPGATAGAILGALVKVSFTSALTRPLVKPVISLTYGDPARMSRGVFESLHRAAREARIVYAGKLKWDYPRTDAASLLSSIKCPTKLVWGALDRIVPIECMKFFADNLAGAACEVLPDAGHVPMLEKPQDFNRAALKFLNSSIPPRSR